MSRYFYYQLANIYVTVTAGMMMTSLRIIPLYYFSTTIPNFDMLLSLIRRFYLCRSKCVTRFSGFYSYYFWRSTSKGGWFPVMITFSFKCSSNIIF